MSEAVARECVDRRYGRCILVTRTAVAHEAHRVAKEAVSPDDTIKVIEAGQRYHVTPSRRWGFKYSHAKGHRGSPGFLFQVNDGKSQLLTDNIKRKAAESAIRDGAITAESISAGAL